MCPELKGLTASFVIRVKMPHYTEKLPGDMEKRLGETPCKNPSPRERDT